MPEHLVDEEVAAYYTGHTKSVIRRWAAEGRLTRHPDTARRRNGVRYDLMELTAAVRDSTGRVTAKGAMPPVLHPPAEPDGDHHDDEELALV